MAESLLIVEDMEDVGRSYMRCLRRYVSKIHVAQTPQEAEAILSQSDPPTLLLCDNWLGHGRPLGAELIPRWRKAYPFLSKVALVTGSDLEVVSKVPGVDIVFEKPPDIDAIIAFFGLAKLDEQE